VLVGILLLLAIAWILVIRSRLWQVWLGRRYGAPLRAVSGGLGLGTREGWRPAVGARGRVGGVHLEIAWRAGSLRHRVVVAVRSGILRRSAVLRPDAGPEAIRARVDALVARVGRRDDPPP